MLVRSRFLLSIKSTAGVRIPIDIVAEGQVIIEIKSVEHLLPIHDAEILTYLRLSGYRVGLLMNFNAALLKYGLRRFVR